MYRMKREITAHGGGVPNTEDDNDRDEIIRKCKKRKPIRSQLGIKEIEWNAGGCQPVIPSLVQITHPSSTSLVMLLMTM